VNTFLQELFQIGIYKRSQGRITRQVTVAAVALGVLLACYRLGQTMMDGWEWNRTLSVSIATALTFAGWWMAFRLVNWPRFADFLIAVEAEMNKVSWPTRAELFRASVVVLVTIFVLAVVLFGYDAIWNWVFRDLLRIL